MDLAPSKALSIHLNPPDSFAGRMIAILVSDGTDANGLVRLKKVAADHGVLVKIIAPKISGVLDSGGVLHPVDAQLGGAPSVLFDAVAILPGDDLLATSKPAQDFLTDAYAHCKFIACNDESAGLFAACGLVDAMDDGIHVLTDDASAADFLTACRTTRFWPREAELTK